MHLDKDIDGSDPKSYLTGVSYIDTSSQLNTSFCSTENISSMSCTNDASPETGISIDTDLIFRSRGLHLCNLNIRHLVPKLDELRISMTHNQCPDIFGMYETFLSILFLMSSLNLMVSISFERTDLKHRIKLGEALYCIFESP